MASLIDSAIRGRIPSRITTPEWTARAWRQVLAWRDRLGWRERIRLAEFDGVHEVRGVETFDFLDRFLAGPPRADR